jgi:Fic family protein
MREWEEFVLDDFPRLPDLIRQCLGHWMFEHIHPFLDGNGRVGRLLMPAALRNKGFTRSACAFVSEPIYHDKSLYVDSLKYARISNDMMAWTRLMLGFLNQSARSNIDRLDVLARIKAKWAVATADVRADSAIHRLLPFALTRPAFTVKDAVDAIGGSFPSVNNAAGRLVELDILQVASGSRRDRLFQASEVLDAFDHFRVRGRKIEDGRQER